MSSTTNHPSNSEEVLRQAARYVARLYSGNMTAREETELNRWLMADDAHQSEFELALQVWDDAYLIAFDSELVNISHEVGVDEEEDPEQNWTVPQVGKRFHPRHWFGVALAASVLLALGVLFSAGVFDSAVDEIELAARYSTYIGERKTIALPDGSQVSLNTNSSVLVDFSHGGRKVILERGEAFFDIAKHKGSPFNVDAGSRSITVLGTKFNVQKLGPEFTLAVVEGVVAVHQKDTPIKVLHDMPNDTAPVLQVDNQYRLQAGAVLTFIETVSEVSTQVTHNPDRFQSWREGIVTFDNQPLDRVVREINRYTAQKIIIRDPAVGAIKVSGVFHLDDIESLLSGLEATFALQVEQTRGDHGEGLVVISARDKFDTQL